MRHSHQQFLLQILLCVQLGSIFEESEGNLSYPRVTNGDAEKPPTLIEQALGLKQALKQFASVISGQIPSLPDKTQFKDYNSKGVFMDLLFVRENSYHQRTLNLRL